MAPRINRLLDRMVRLLHSAPERETVAGHLRRRPQDLPDPESASGRPAAGGDADASAGGYVDAAAGGYAGDFTGALPPISYSPKPDGRPDPGEVVWAPVPFQEDASRTKDRPVLLIARDGPWLLALPMTSKDHDRDARQEASQGRYWVDLGAGDWDRRRRPSEAALHRILRLDPASIRREGAIVDRDRFEQVIAALIRYRSDGPRAI